MKTPIELQLDGITVGEILSFSYETPWATGKVKFKDSSLFEKLVSNHTTVGAQPFSNAQSHSFFSKVAETKLKIKSLFF